jgi:hypothetical protein
MPPQLFFVYLNPAVKTTRPKSYSPHDICAKWSREEILISDDSHQKLF